MDIFLKKMMEIEEKEFLGFKELKFNSEENV
jgi:hypothetical protein